MAGLQLKVTPAGRAAIVNLPNTGTNAVVIAQIGVTATAFDANTLPASLPGELKRLSTFGGVAVSDDTIHVTLRDDSVDVYSLRGFALYLEDGTLFALYGQAGVILEKSAQAMLLLSTDVKFADIAATSIEFGDANFINPPASTTVQGVTQYATSAEALAGTASNRGIVASALKYVLDSRFGTGAPSTFVKGLLNLATAALVRAALEIKSAALKDEGAGNGLDADKLDGQHGAFYRAWANLTDVPESLLAWAGIAPTDKANTVEAWQRGSAGPTLATYSGDLNDASGFQAFYAGGAAANKSPIGNSNILGWGYANYETQMGTRGGRMCFRQRENGVWGDWREVVHSADLNLSDVMLKSAAQDITGAKTFKGALQSDHTNGTGFIVNRSDSATNSNIEYRSTGGSVFAGQTLNGSAWAIGSSNNLSTTGNRWFHVTASAAFVANSVVWHAGNLDPATFVPVAPASLPGSNWDTQTTSGFFRASGSYAGTSPGFSGDYDVIQSILPNGEGSQIAVYSSSTISFRCADTAGVWSPWSQFWHEGNAPISQSPTGSTLAQRNSSGDLTTRLFRSTYTSTNGSIGAIMTQVDVGGTDNNYLRPSTPAQVKAALGIATGDVSGLTALIDSRINTALANYLPKNNPTFTGTMTGPQYNET